MTGIDDPKTETRQPGGFASVLAVCTLEQSDEVSVRLAKRLAERDGSRLAVLAVCEQSVELSQFARHVGADLQEAIDWFEATMRDEAEALAERLGVPASAVTVRVGKPFLEIIREVNAGKHDLVIKAAERLEGVSGYLFSSTDQHLIRKCPCPVWLSTSQTTGDDGPVIAAIDAGEAAAIEPETMAALNDKIIAVASSIASFKAVPFYVVTVWDAPGEGLAQRWFGDEGTVVDYVLSVERERRSALDSIFERSRGSAFSARPSNGPTPLVERGFARAVIPEVVNRHAASLLVLGTVARTGLSGFLIGNTAEDVLNTVMCSVVAVKPDAFVSPVS